MRHVIGGLGFAGNAVFFGWFSTGPDALAPALALFVTSLAPWVLYWVAAQTLPVIAVLGVVLAASNIAAMVIQRTSTEAVLIMLSYPFVAFVVVAVVLVVEAGVVARRAG